MKNFQSICSTKSHIQQYECQVCMKDNSNKLISIDGCLWQEIKWLWNNNIHTIGSCCGCHINSNNCRYIQVIKDDINKMIELGYKSFYNEFNVLLFKPKTTFLKDINK